MKPISLHKPFIPSQAKTYIQKVLDTAAIGSGGNYMEHCNKWFLTEYKTESVFLTNSCTDALEMISLVLNFKPGDEVILPSYTFVSTANAFLLRDCVLKFADSSPTNPNISLNTILPLVSKKTKAIVVMHYAGIPVDMDPILKFAFENNIYVIEDAAQAIGSKYNGRYLGTLSDLSSISFHATKLISCGEGGVCIVNQEKYKASAELIFEKGTNKSAFQRHEINKYEWLQVGSSYGMSELQAALLFSQLETLSHQLKHRKDIWNVYMKTFDILASKGLVDLPHVPEFAEINGTHFYILLRDSTQRHGLIEFLNENKIETAFHYLALHQSPFYKNRLNQQLPMALKYESALLRLPLHHEVSENDVIRIFELVQKYLTRH